MAQRPTAVKSNMVVVVAILVILLIVAASLGVLYYQSSQKVASLNSQAFEHRWNFACRYRCSWSSKCYSNQ